MPDLDLLHLALSAPILAVEAGEDFVRIDAIWRLPRDGGMPHLYCTTELWPDSYVGRIAQQTAAIVELESQLGTAHAELAMLRQTLDRLLDAPVVAAPPSVPAPALSPATDASDLPCPHGCGKAGLKNGRAVALHVQRAHLGMQARPRAAPTADPAPTAPPPPRPPPRRPRRRQMTPPGRVPVAGSDLGSTAHLRGA